MIEFTDLLNQYIAAKITATQDADYQIPMRDLNDYMTRVAFQGEEANRILREFRATLNGMAS